MNIVDLSDIWVTFNLKENLLSKIKVGDKLRAKVPALNDKEITLKVTYIKVLVLADELHGLYLGCARQCAGGERIDECLHLVGIIVHLSAHSAHEVNKKICSHNIQTIHDKHTAK